VNTPRVLAAASHVLGTEIHLMVVACRWPRAGHGEQDLHRSNGRPAEEVVCVWLFDDMTLDNGPTRMVPGSHLLEHGPGQEVGGDLRAPHPREILITGRAGSVLVFHDRIYHGGTTHNGGGPRRTLQTVYTVRSSHESGVQLKRREETLARLTPAQVWLLDPAEAAPAAAD
jgi:ectoine hydroxylase-related dioxygenase (phytanoyl-CoA dioxygenase family)